MSSESSGTPPQPPLGSRLDSEVPAPAPGYFEQVDATLRQVEAERSKHRSSTDAVVLPYEPLRYDRDRPTVNDTPGWSPLADTPAAATPVEVRRRSSLLTAAAMFVIAALGIGAAVLLFASSPAENVRATDGVVPTTTAVTEPTPVMTVAPTATVIAEQPTAVVEPTVVLAPTAEITPTLTDTLDPSSAMIPDERRDECVVTVPDDVQVIGPTSGPSGDSSGEAFWWVLPGVNSTEGTLGVVVVEAGGAHLGDAGVVFAKSGSIVSSIGLNGNAGRGLFYERGATLAFQTSLRGPLIQCGEIVTSSAAPAGGGDPEARPIDVAFAPDTESWPTVELQNEGALSTLVFTDATAVCLDRYRLRFEGLHDSSPVEARITFAGADGSTLASHLVFVNDVAAESDRTHYVSYSTGDGGRPQYGEVTDVVRDACFNVTEPGSYSITIELDPADLIAEDDEANNSFTKVFELGGF